MKVSFLLLALTTFASLCMIISAEQNGQEKALIEDVETSAHFAKKVEVLCKWCFPGHTKITALLIRAKGCPKTHVIRPCLIRTGFHHFHKGLRCSCFPPSPTPSPTPTSSPTPTPTSSPTPTPTSSPTPSTTSTPTPSPTPSMSMPVMVMCDEVARSGGEGTTNVDVELGQNSGTFTLTYDMFSVPDQLEIFYEGNRIFTTGGLVSGTATRMITYGPGTATSVEVVVSAPRSGTRWNFMVSCPK